MTYSSCCGTENYASMRNSSPPVSYGTLDRGNPVRDSYGPNEDPLRLSASEHSWYQNNANGNPGYDAGINKVAGAYLQTPSCGKYKPVNNLLL